MAVVPRRTSDHPGLRRHLEIRAQSLQNRIADAITSFAGSMWFVYIHVVWFSGWILFGVEDYPYGLLTMIVSLEAIFLSTFVMITQNRQDEARKHVVEEEYRLVQLEKGQNDQLIDLSKQILELTQKIDALNQGSHEIRLAWATLPVVAVTCRLYRDGEIAEEGFDPSKVSDFLEEKDTLVWLDLEDPSPDEIAVLEEEFSLHPLAVEDALHRDQRPKVEVYEGYFFLVLQALRLEGREIQNQEIHCFVGENYLITLRFPPPFDLTEVRRRWSEEQELAREGGGYLLHALIDEVVDGYFDIIDEVELRTENLEEAVFGEHVAENIQQRIFHAKKELTEFRRRVMPLREVLDLLEENRSVVTPALRPYYRDVADHVIRSLEAIDNLRELLSVALDAHLSRVSTELNVVMKQVTSWAAIILAPTLVAGIYGMNFRNMPELDWRFGYPFALLLMFLSSFVLYRVFKRRDWL